MASVIRDFVDSQPAKMIRHLDLFLSLDVPNSMWASKSKSLASISKYENSLKICGLDTLKTRRNQLSLSFAIKCTKNAATKDMFPEKDSQAKTRFHEKYVVTKSYTERLASSAIPFMQQLLNRHQMKKTKYLSVILILLIVNY